MRNAHHCFSQASNVMWRLLNVLFNLKSPIYCNKSSNCHIWEAENKHIFAFLLKKWLQRSVIYQNNCLLLICFFFITWDECYKKGIFKGKCVQYCFHIRFHHFFSISLTVYNLKVCIFLCILDISRSGLTKHPGGRERIFKRAAESPGIVPSLTSPHRQVELFLHLLFYSAVRF